MRSHATSSVVLVLGVLAGPARSEEPPRVPAYPTTSVAVFPDVDPRPQNAAVAAFPDAETPRAAPEVDPSIELLATNPYEEQLQAYERALNLYGDDASVENPYTDELRLANPYSEELRFANPYSAETARAAAP